MARLEGFEPPTTWFVVKYSIQLSYRRTQERRFLRKITQIGKQMSHKVKKVDIDALRNLWECLNMTNRQVWLGAFEEAQSLLQKILANSQLIDSCEKFSNLLIDTYQKNNKVFSCGNGGSHCDAMHFAEELTGRYRKDRQPLGALALGDSSHVTCTSNDYGFEYIFERQVRGLARPGDVLLGISTSGNSKNVILAVQAAQAMGMKTVALLGRDGGQLKSMVDIPIVVPAMTSDRIQEVHIKIIHTVIETVERAIFPENY